MRMSLNAGVVVCGLIGFVALAQPPASQPAPDDVSPFAPQLGVPRIDVQQIGDPVAVDGDMIVGVKRGEDGHIESVLIYTDQRIADFHRNASAGVSGFSYSGYPVKDERGRSQFSAAMDLDDDGRIDKVMLPRRGATRATIQIRIEDRFETAEPVGDGKLRILSDQQIVKFDLAAHEWLPTEE